MCSGRLEDYRTFPHPIRIVIADGHQVVRAGIRALLESERDLTVVGETDNVDDLFTEARRTKPDVTLLTYGLPGCTDVEAYKQLFRSLSGVRIIVLVKDNDAAPFAMPSKREHRESYWGISVVKN